MPTQTNQTKEQRNERERARRAIRKEIDASINQALQEARDRNDIIHEIMLMEKIDVKPRRIYLIMRTEDDEKPDAILTDSFLNYKPFMFTCIDEVYIAVAVEYPYNNSTITIAWDCALIDTDDPRSVEPLKTEDMKGFNGSPDLLRATLYFEDRQPVTRMKPF